MDYEQQTNIDSLIEELQGAFSYSDGLPVAEFPIDEQADGLHFNHVNKVFIFLMKAHNLIDQTINHGYIKDFQQLDEVSSLAFKVLAEAYWLDTRDRNGPHIIPLMKNRDGYFHLGWIKHYTKNGVI